MASIVYSAADQAQKNAAPGSVQQASSQQSLQFGLRWLATPSDSQSHTDSLQRMRPQRRPGGSEPAGILARWFQGMSRIHNVRLGLVGPAFGYGLAHQNRDIAANLNVDRWLIRGPVGTAAERSTCRLNASLRDLGTREIEAWLDGLDVVLFVEHPSFSNLAQTARRLGVRVICVANWEWLSPGLEWVDCVDLMLCPTRHTALMLMDWKQRFGFEWEVSHIPWPIDTNRFQFRQRQICRRFVYVHGSGGATAVRCDGSETKFRRKGLQVLLQAARQLPHIPIVIYAFPHQLRELPSNVELRRPPSDNRLLYSDGDVCVQPSHWEGLGLPLLECQAAGMPLITTDVPPMNEHHPLEVIPATLESVRLSADLWIPAARIDPQDLATVLQSAFGRRIGRQSRTARRFVMREHSWKVAGPKIRRYIWEAARRPERATEIS